MSDKKNKEGIQESARARIIAAGGNTSQRTTKETPCVEQWKPSLGTLGHIILISVAIVAWLLWVLTTGQDATSEVFHVLSEASGSCSSTSSIPCGASNARNQFIAKGASSIVQAATQGGMGNEVHVAITTSASEAVGAFAVINSTIQHMANPQLLRVHVLTPGKDRLELDSLVKAHFSDVQQGLIEVLDTNEKTHDSRIEIHGGLRLAQVTNDVTYSRFYFASIFPKLNRIIYFGNDLVVRSDVSELWAYDLGGKPLGAVQRCRERFEDTYLFETSEARQFLRKFAFNECIFNDGVLLFDLKQWRVRGSTTASSFEKELIEWTTMNMAKPMFERGAQSVLNLVFYRNYMHINPTWNVMDVGDPTLSPTSGAIHVAKVLHWSSFHKPWIVSPRTLHSEYFSKALPKWEDITIFEQYTAVIATHGNQIELLKQVVQSFEGEILVFEIVIVWNDPETDCPTADLRSAFTKDGIGLRCLKQSTDDQQNRLLIGDHLITEAVFHHGDNTIFDPASLELGFKVWRRNQKSIVGFQPRVHVSKKGIRHYSSHLTDGYHHFVTGKGFFVSRTLMQAYRQINDGALVAMNKDMAFDCDAIAINLLAVKRGSSGSIAVEGQRLDLAFNGPHNVNDKTMLKESDQAVRSTCLAQFEGVFGRVFMDGLPKTRQIAMAYDSNYNTIVYRDVVPQESICFGLGGLQRCRVRQCAVAGPREPCISNKYYIPE
jgi:lipopolysaccharide biosynthesis glycosyltransferase